MCTPRLSVLVANQGQPSPLPADLVIQRRGLVKPMPPSLILTLKENKPSAVGVSFLALKDEEKTQTYSLKEYGRLLSAKVCFLYLVSFPFHFQPPLVRELGLGEVYSLPFLRQLNSSRQRKKVHFK